MDLNVILKKFSEFNYVEVREHKINSTHFFIINGYPAGLASTIHSGYSVRAFKDSAMYFTSSSNFEDLSPLSFSLKEWEKGYSTDQRTSGEYVVNEKEKISDVSLEEKQKILVEISNNLKNININSKIVSINFIYSESIEEKNILFEDGTTIHGLVPRINVSASVSMVSDKASATFYEEFGGSGGFELIKNWDIQNTLAEKIRNVDEVLTKGKGVTPGRKDVIFSNMLTGIMAHESVGHPFEADRVLGREFAQAGLSYLVNRNFGEKIGSDIVNVVDDPTLPNSSGFYLIDDEGIKARAKFLIKDGKINELLQDRFSAYKFGVSSNGSARAANFDREPLIRMSNTFFMPSNFTFDELLEDVKDGIYLKSYMEWNIDDLRIGQRYIGLEAYEIKNGEIKEPLLFPVIEGTTFEFLSSIDAIDNTLKFYYGTCGKGDPDQGIPVWLGGPNMRLRNVSVKVRGYE
ncbi:TldD/PmbA family protein [Sulfolobus sp. S-194]|uniref:TldD/PmbA family protein n=1 Tax=Sulfolobus sp. S-194 TaxID=2512240 RepID=UPI001437052C|nr:TldD/PmbA family protein [Sulfolobus sp. S-194]QIW23526.1 TldD/PmbA family protein [Sulfolobus sp. S-194]